MKKTIAILLVAVLALSSVFAGFSLSGEANVSLTGDIDGKTLGFKNGDNKVKVTIEGATAEKVNEGEIYAGIKASLTIKDIKSEDSNTYGLVAKEVKIKEAYITDGNWKLSILEAAKTPTFAKGWETLKNDKDEDKAVVLTPVVGDGVPGVTFEMAGWTAGVGLKADFEGNTGKNVMLSVKTPEFDFDAVKVQAGAGFTNNAGKRNVGFGAKAAYATDAFSATVGADAVVDVKASKFDAAVSANVAIAPVTVDAVFATKTTLLEKVKTYVDRAYAGKGDKENYLSAKVVTDLNSFDVPVKLTVVALDLLKDQYFDVEAATVVKDVNLTVFGGYQISNSKLHAVVAADYTVEKVGKIYGALDLAGVNAVDTLNVKVGVENTTLVAGATLKTEYKSGNLLKSVIGTVTTSAQIKF
ncbi:MAG: hypothetical protein PUH25_05880 [Spirochaetales bacterium]|nr:hypothetical protein [Spirochaetales bacterium]